MSDFSLFDHYQLSDDQIRPVQTRRRDIAVVAGAGTGKTRTLVGRFLSLIAEGLPLRRIVAITFTRKAAREMRNRVRRELEAALQAPTLDETARQRLSAQRDQLDAARISTIHTFCAELLRTHPAEAGLDPRFGLLDEAEAALARRAAVTHAMAAAADAPASIPLFTALGVDGLRQVLDLLLRQRLDASDSLENLPADPLAHWREILRRRQTAALERLWRSPPFANAMADLRAAQPVKESDRMVAQQALVLGAVERATPELPLPRRLENLAALDEIDLRGGSQAAWAGGRDEKDQVKEALRTLRALWQDNSLLHLDLNEADATVAALLPELRRRFEEAQDVYEALKAESEALDFDDLEARALDLLQTHPDVLAHWQSTVRALLVDEFQDTNQRQRDLITLLCNEPGKLFIVGDAKQSIYRFRGADVVVFRRERERIDAGAGLVSRLDTSYRTHAPLVDGLNKVMRPLLGEPAPERPPWEEPFAALDPARDEPRFGLKPPYIHFLLAAGSKGDGALDRAAAALVEQIQALTGETDLTPGDVAILCRSTRAFAAYENALDAAGVPYLTISGRGFYERPEIRDLINGLQAIADPTDDLALLGLLRSPAGGLTDGALLQLAEARREAEEETPGLTLWDVVLDRPVPLSPSDETALTRTRDLIRNLRAQAGRTPVADLLKALLDRTGYRAALLRAGLPRAVRNVDKLLADAHASEETGIAAFLDYLGGVRDVLTREGEARTVAEGAVQIMTIHAAKGLEFPVVVLGDINASGPNVRPELLLDPDLGLVLPVQDDDGQKATGYVLAAERDTSQEEAERARLLYVAATRAEELLIFNGNVAVHDDKGVLNRLNGWLAALADITGLADVQLEAYAPGGDQVHELELAVKTVPIGVHIVESGYVPHTGRRSAPDADLAPEELRPTPALLHSWKADEEEHADDDPRVWRVVSRETELDPPSWLVGNLIHEAIAGWRFPGDLDGNTYDEWLRSRARSYGMDDAVPLQRTISRVRTLLNRLRQHTLYRAIENAEQRLHEIPYAITINDRPDFGTIDLLFQQDGAWTVVDFKSDRLRSGADRTNHLVQHKYPDQLRRYGTAVRHMWGSTPRLLLCLLDLDNRVRSLPVEM